MCAAPEFLNSRTGKWLREKCSLCEAAGNRRREPRNYIIYPCPSLRGLVLKSLRHGDVTAGARAADAAIRRAGLEDRRKTNPVVDGQLVPRARNANGHGEKALRKRRREESAAATPSPRARRR